MGLKIDIQADSKFPVDRQRLRSALNAFWQELGVDGEAQLSVAIVGSRKMGELARNFLKKKEATDVLAFAQQDAEGDEHGFVTPDEIPLELGDIVLCYPLIIDQAADEGVMVDEKIIEKALHGLKHIMGNSQWGKD